MLSGLPGCYDVRAFIAPADCNGGTHHQEMAGPDGVGVSTEGRSQEVQKGNGCRHLLGSSGGLGKNQLTQLLAEIMEGIIGGLTKSSKHAHSGTQGPL